MRSIRAYAATCLAILFALLLSLAASAVEPNEMLADPKLEARARAISQELRCMVCQNESIDESQAPLAHDLRVLVRERLKAGDTDEQIRAFLVARYGEFVLLRPPFEWHTALLWGTPPALLLIGLAMLILVCRRRPGMAAAALEPPGLSAEEQARLARLIDGETGT